MDETYITIILSLLGFLQTIFMFILAYLFKIQGTIFKKMDDNKKECGDKIDKNAEHDKEDKKELEQKMIELLDKHYVTIGQFTTLEERLIGKINGLITAMGNLTDTLKEKLKD